MKKYLTGLILGILLSTSMIAYASSANVIEVYYNVKDIVINGVSQMPDQKPFVYNGSTYVPLRYISDSLGYDVGWDGDTQTVYIGETPGEDVVYPGNGIEAMNIHNSAYSSIGYSYMDKTLLDNVGNEHSSYISFSTFYPSLAKNMIIEFPTNGEYSQFSGVLAIAEEYKSSEAIAKLNIYADDKLIYTDQIQAGDMPRDINIDITNAIKVKYEMIFITDYGNMSQTKVAIFEPTFQK